MTTLMQQALRRLTSVPEDQQDRVAERVLKLPELSDAEHEAVDGASPAPSLVSIISAPNEHTRSKTEIDEALGTLRDEWDR